jgi:hypothetical protein
LLSTFCSGNNLYLVFYLLFRDVVPLCRVLAPGSGGERAMSENTDWESGRLGGLGCLRLADYRVFAGGSGLL